MFFTFVHIGHLYCTLFFARGRSLRRMFHFVTNCTNALKCNYYVHHRQLCPGTGHCATNLIDSVLEERVRVPLTV